MLVKDIMTENPVTATELMSVAEALGLLYELDVRHLPVVRGSELAGIVSDRDLRGFFQNIGNKLNYSVADLHQGSRCLESRSPTDRRGPIFIAP